MEDKIMTKDEKDLLTKVLCEQLSYGVMCDRLGVAKKLFSVSPYEVYCLELDNGEYMPSKYKLEDIKPYLRPLSSMTEEEKEQTRGFWIDADTKIFAKRLIDFYNKNHFDYRGLIPKGLAIAAVGSDNPYKENGDNE